MTDKENYLPELQVSLQKEANLEFFEAEANKIVVKDYTSARQALSMGLQTRKIFNKIESERKAMIQPYMDYQRDLNRIVKAIQSELKTIEERLESKVFNWMEEQRDNPFASVDEITVEDGTIVFDEKWSFEVKDYTIVPMEFLKVDEEAIKEQIQSGVRNIPGINIFKTVTPKMRVKNK